MFSMTALIRSLLATDRADWDRMWTAYLEFYESEVPAHVYDITFARLIDPKRLSQHCLIAEKNRKPVGLAHYIYHTHNWRIDDVCYLQDLFVDPNLRGQGVGRTLIEAVYEAADINGSPAVYWMTQDFNTNARQLYDRIGELTPFIKYSR
jgi:GNAT superfamily N-acetyltransferase